MDETPTSELTPGQIVVLERLLKTGFEFVTLEHVVRYLPVEKNGFVALLDPSGGRLKLFGEVGYRIGDGVGMLVAKKEGKAFVWKGRAVRATDELLESYDQFKKELSDLVQGPAQ